MNEMVWYGIGRLVRPISVLMITFATTSLLIFFTQPQPHLQTKSSPQSQLHKSMNSTSRTFILWLHGLGDSGPANQPIKSSFSSPSLSHTSWAFPSAPLNPVSCNDGAIMRSWFDIYKMPITAESPKDENGTLQAVQDVHTLINKEIDAGTDPKDIFICGFSQGGALTIASVLFYPRTLGGGAIFSGWIPFNLSITERIFPEAKKTPILWMHGRADRTVLFNAGEAASHFLEQAGMSCEFKAYPNLGHSLSMVELRALESWIEEHLQGHTQ